MKLCPRVPPLVVRSISEKDRKTWKNDNFFS
jgi:hypothetical protein